MKEKLMYNGEEVKEVRNACGGGYNLMTPRLLQTIRNSAKQALEYKQTVVKQDGMEEEVKLKDIYIVSSK